MKSYVSNRWPFLRLGPRVQFSDGLFSTDDPALQAVIENSESYGLHIHPRDAVPDAERPRPEPEPDEPDEPDEPARIRSGRRGTR